MFFHEAKYISVMSDESLVAAVLFLVSGQATVFEIRQTSLALTIPYREMQIMPFKANSVLKPAA